MLLVRGRGGREGSDGHINIKEDINNPLVQKNITEAVKRLAGFLSIGQMWERVFSDLLVT